ncbi:MAG: hypothetical protein CM15mP120_01760 [Pseudomonadota bacterium]|nr:MAG: hypothetical protein CM15mP120_01760 [Pseudomonadota bacterium]
MTVFQRTPNYTMPAHNRPLTDEFRQKAINNYDAIRQQQRESMTGIVGYGFGFWGGGQCRTHRDHSQTTEAQRAALVEEEGFVAIRRFADIALDPEANELACDMYRQQIERVIKDPQTARANAQGLSHGL